MPCRRPEADTLSSAGSRARPAMNRREMLTAAAASLRAGADSQRSDDPGLAPSADDRHPRGGRARPGCGGDDRRRPRRRRAGPPDLSSRSGRGRQGAARMERGRATARQPLSLGPALGRPRGSEGVGPLRGHPGVAGTPPSSGRRSSRSATATSKRSRATITGSASGCFSSPITSAIPSATASASAPTPDCRCSARRSWRRWRGSEWSSTFPTAAI